MGEYAIHNYQEIKIGTCSNMYYLRYEDRTKVQPNATHKGLRYRLPFPDEDAIGPGYYEPFQRGYRLYKITEDGYHQDFSDEDTADDPGSIQMSHTSGLLISVPCYHGIKLPDLGNGIPTHWNGKSWFFELVFVKTMQDGTVAPIIQCKHCRHMWRCDWADIEDYIHGEMRKRLSKHWSEV